MLAYLLIIVTAFCLVGVSLIQLVGEYLFNQRVREEERVTEELAGHISPLLTSYKTDDMYALLRLHCGRLARHGLPLAPHYIRRKLTKWQRRSPAL